ELGTVLSEFSYNHAAATTSRHVCMAAALKARCVLADVRWRWTLKVFWAAACTERNLCADPTLLNPCILCSRRRVGDANSRLDCCATDRGHGGLRGQDRGL